jgi:hypothetical protein
MKGIISYGTSVVLEERKLGRTTYILRLLASPDISVGEESQNRVCTTPLWLGFQPRRCENRQGIDQTSDLTRLNQVWQPDGDVLPWSVVVIRQSLQRKTRGKETVGWRDGIVVEIDLRRGNHDVQIFSSIVPIKREWGWMMKRCGQGWMGSGSGQVGKYVQESCD